MKYKFVITGLDCPNCAAKLASQLSDITGVESAKINFLTEKLTVDSELSADELLPLLSDVAARFEKGIKVTK